MQLADKVAVVTGGAGGIGKAIGHRFGAAGVKVVLADVLDQPLQAAIEELKAAGCEAHGVVTDVTDFASVQALAGETVERFGVVDIVCNNAGTGGVSEGYLWDHDLADWRWGLDVNVLGVIHGMKAFVPLLLDRPEGYVVNTCSGNGGFAPIAKGALGGPAGAVYPMTKAAVLCLTESLFIHLSEAAPQVHCGVLFPGGFLNTDIWQSWKTRPETYKPTQERKSAFVTVDDVVERFDKAGVKIQFTPLSDVADALAEGIEADRFWMINHASPMEAQVGQRAESIQQRGLPDYLITDTLARSASDDGDD